MKRLVIFSIIFYIVSNTFIFAQENVDIPVIPSEDQELDGAAGYARNLKNFDGSVNAYSKLKAYISLLDSKGIKALKSHPAYPRLGDIYMYGAIYLEKEYGEEKIIELYKKALELRADPRSNYTLATIYKSKFDEALKKNDLEKEKEYGKKVYEYLTQYIKLTGNRSSKYTKIINYFSAYK